MKFSEKELEEYKQKVFDFYKSHGFPYFELDDDKLLKVVYNLFNFDTSRILLEENHLKQFMVGLNLVNYFMPHIFEVRCHSFKSPLDCFIDDDMLKKAIHKRISMGDNMSHAGMRKALSWTHGTHRVSNFRPSIAKYIYDNYSGDGCVLDFSCGYGGRLFGAYSSDKVKTYIGTDPCQKTFEGLVKLDNYLNSQTEKEMNVSLYEKPFENLELKEDSVDLAFSSPPYFNTEEYDYEESQSFIKYDTKEKWRDGFLTPLIVNSHRYLKDGGYFIINVANVKTYPTLEEDVVNLAENNGFILVKTYKMRLSKLMGSGYKFEPIFVFVKK
jgi:SAM-dependent methyltransferase